MNRDVNIELQHEMDRLKSIMKDQIESTTGDSDIKKVGKYFVKSAQSVSNLLPKYAKHYIKEAEMEFIKSKSAVIRSTKKPFRK